MYLAARLVVDCAMVKKSQSSGFLSKVVGYFRAPDSELQGDDDSQQSRTDDTEKNALKQLIERKRSDDHIRRREFNHLRDIRRGAGSHIQSSERATGFSVSSGFDANDRASTIKKIDAIETHMVKTWAKGKNSPPKEAPTKEVPTKPTSKAATAGAPDFLDSMNLDFTALMSKTSASEFQLLVDSPPEPSDPQSTQQVDAVASVFFPIPERPPAPVMEDVHSGPLADGLQEAAILFAEGDSGSAEQILLGMLQSQSVAPVAADLLAFALFDLYRATGQQDGFDVVAMDYAERFARSPGEWFSLPDMVAHAAEHAESKAAQPPEPEPEIDPEQETEEKAAEKDTSMYWMCSALLDATAVTALRSRFKTPKEPWFVDWEQLREIDPSTAKEMADLLTYWCKLPSELHFSNIDTLLKALERRTPADDNQTDPIWWLTRLDALCIAGRHDDFESLALDYCVVYEVSPPSWFEVACTFVSEDAASALATTQDDPESVQAPLDGPDNTRHYAKCALSGELSGDTTQAMALLQAASAANRHVIVNCALLIRVDFVAAGDILNWALACEALEGDVQFIQVPRLVAVLFQMLEINLHAHVSVRPN
jgi:ABC-type transporter Mla MlaB component